MNKLYTAKNTIIFIETLFIVLFIMHVYGLIPVLSGGWKEETIQMGSPVLPFVYSFNAPGVLQEAGKPDESSSRYWWLNSGGVMEIENNRGLTNQGEINKWSRWRILYGLNNPADTDSGLHPQNVFRLITRDKWQNFSQEIYFKINRDNLSQSQNRNISNGVFLISRYEDGNNLYYAGVRVDGTAVVKKKINGEYFTLDQSRIWDGESYNRDFNPSILPKNKWIGLRSEIKDLGAGTASVKFFLDLNESGEWQLVFEAIDDGKTYGGFPVSLGAAGLRSDFMDIEFRDFKIDKIPY